MRRTRLAGLPVLIALVCYAPAFAAVLLDESFNYGTGNLEVVSGGVWIKGSGNSSTVVNQNLTYPDLISGQNNSMQHGRDRAPYTTTQIGGTLSTGDVIYFSYLLHVPNESNWFNSNGLTNGIFTRLLIGGTNSRMRINLRKDNTAANSFQLAHWNTNAGNLWTGFFPADTTVLIVGRYTHPDAGQQAQEAVWINPTNLGVDEPNVPTPTFSGLQSISGPGGTDLTFQIASHADRLPSQLWIDHVRFGTTWADVTPIPEPTSTLLLGLTLSLTLVRYRRKVNHG